MLESMSQIFQRIHLQKKLYQEMAIVMVALGILNRVRGLLKRYLMKHRFAFEIFKWFLNFALICSSLFV